MSAVLFFLLGAAIFSLGESKQTAVFFLVLALVAAAGVIYLRWRASDDNRPRGPAPAPCADCGVVIEWPSPFAFVAFGVAHLACVEAREAKLCDNCHMPSGAALLHQR